MLHKDTDLVKDSYLVDVNISTLGVESLNMEHMVWMRQILSIHTCTVFSGLNCSNSLPQLDILINLSNSLHCLLQEIAIISVLEYQRLQENRLQITLLNFDHNLPNDIEPNASFYCHMTEPLFKNMMANCGCQLNQIDVGSVKTT